MVAVGFGLGDCFYGFDSERWYFKKSFEYLSVGLLL